MLLRCAVKVPDVERVVGACLTANFDAVEPAYFIEAILESTCDTQERSRQTHALIRLYTTFPHVSPCGVHALERSTGDGRKMKSDMRIHTHPKRHCSCTPTLSQRFYVSIFFW